MFRKAIPLLLAAVLATAGVVAAPAAAAATCTPVSSTQVLKITKPGVYDGCGQTVRGIENTASDVVIQNFISKGASNYGIWSYGLNVTIQNNTVTKVLYKGNDLDGIRFFGTGTKLLNNRVYDVAGNNPQDSHTDCMQTYANSRPGSSNVVIQGNKCEGTALHQCLMAEGPLSTDGGGGGGGVSRNWLIADNQFECYANQSVSLRDIDNVRVERNRFTGVANKAVQVTDGSTGVTFSGNFLGPKIKTLYGG